MNSCQKFKVYSPSCQIKQKEPKSLLDSNLDLVLPWFWMSTAHAEVFLKNHEICMVYRYGNLYYGIYQNVMVLPI